MINGLDVILVKDPYSDWSPENGDRSTGIAFANDEWGSFYFNTLKAESSMYVEGEPWIEYAERERVAFQDSLQEYPLLARVYDYYQDASFVANEITALQEELARAGTLDLDDEAKAFYEGMREAAKLAASLEMGIRLSSI